MGVTEVARELYGASGAGVEQQGRRSIYKWVRGVEPQTIARQQIWRAVVALERRLRVNAPTGTGAPSGEAKPAR